MYVLIWNCFSFCFTAWFRHTTLTERATCCDFCHKFWKTVCTSCSEYWHQSLKWSDSFFCVCARCSKQLLLPPFANRLRGKPFLGMGIRTMPHTLTPSYGNLKTLLVYYFFFMLLLTFKESFLIIMAAQDILRGHLVCLSITVGPSISVNLSCPDLLCLSSWL